MLNLARLQMFSKALASVQQPPVSLQLQESSNRLRTALDNSDADFQGAFASEWVSLAKTPALRQSHPEVFEKYRFVDLLECVEIETMSYKSSMEWLRLGLLYLEAGACDKAQEIVLLMNPKLDGPLIPTLVYHIFIKLIGSDCEQWKTGMEYLNRLPFSQDIMQHTYVILYEHFHKKNNPSRAVEILRLLDENHTRSDWLCILAECMLIPHGKKDLLIEVLPKVKGQFYPHQLKFVFNKWIAWQRQKKELLPSEKEIQVIRDHFYQASIRNGHPNAHSTLNDLANLLIEFNQYSMALDLLKKCICCTCINVKCDVSKTLRNFESKLNGDSISLEALTLRQRLEWVELALMRQNTSLQVSKPAAALLN